MKSSGTQATARASLKALDTGSKRTRRPGPRQSKHRGEAVMESLPDLIVNGGLTALSLEPFALYGDRLAACST